MNPYRGEVTLTLGEEAYRLRPTFQALATIEARVGCALPLWLHHIARRGMTAHEMLLVLEEGAKAAGTTLPRNTLLSLPLTVERRALYMETALGFLLAALGMDRFFADDKATACETAEAHAQERLKDPTVTLPWREMMESAFCLFGLTPEAFWNLTLPEFTIYMDYFRRRSEALLSPTREELTRLMRQCPD